MRRVSIILFALYLSLLTTHAMAQQSYGVLFYNVENLFDTTDDPATDDQDMHPLSDKRWNEVRYKHKLSDIAKVIGEFAQQHDFPALIGLAEVENRGVIEDLIREKELQPAHYDICHFDSPDHRGIDVALLIRSDIFHLKGCRAIATAYPEHTRDILTAWGSIGQEKVFIAVVHWPSRTSGVKASEHKRIACANQLRTIIDSVQHHAPATKIIVMGDMNDNPDNQSIKQILQAKSRVRNITTNDLFAPLAKVEGGSSVYDKRWNRYDNIIVSANMLGRERMHLRQIDNKHMGATFTLPFMLNDNGHPLPTYKRTEYIGGVSDHLPIYIILEVE